MGTRLLLVRHGQTAWHADNRYAGSSEVDLTETGLEQAEQLARFVAELPQTQAPSALVSSPQQRARKTIEACEHGTGLTAEIVDDLREAHFGVAEGRTLDELRASDPDLADRFLADPVDGAFPDAEPPREVAARGARALRGITERHPEGTVLVVAHNTLLRVTLAGLLGIELANYRRVLPRLENTALTEIEIGASGTSLFRLNLPTGAPV